MINLNYYIKNCMKNYNSLPSMGGALKLIFMKLEKYKKKNGSNTYIITNR